MASPGATSPRWDSKQYLAYRPRYPDALFNEIMAFGVPSGDAALDVGCASGQVIPALASRFSRIVGIDLDPSALALAVKEPNVEYSVGTAEATGLLDASVDLITAGAAVHWFDTPAFFAEARRVLKPGGVLACWCYNSTPTFPGDAAAGEAAFSRIRSILWPFCHPRLQEVMEKGYTVYVAPAEAALSGVELRQVPMAWTASVGTVVGWIRSWSAYLTMCEERGATAAEAAVVAFQEELLAATGAASLDAPLTITLTLDLLLAKKPSE